MSVYPNLSESNRWRQQMRARLKRELRANRDGLRLLFEECPPEVEHLTVAELCAYARSGRWAAPSMEKVGRDAAMAGINLFVPLGRASARTRQWAAVHGVERVQNHRAHRIVFGGWE